MPIVGRTPRECFETFTDHLRPLVAQTITHQYPLLTWQTKTKLVLSFREAHPIAIPIETSYGRLYFYLGQALEAVPDGESAGFRLTTRQYWYRLQHEPDRQAQAALRWEYDSFTPSDRHARHHAQMPAELQLGGGTMDLDKAHLPTGWVLIEEVIRFLIVDLGIEPPCGAEAWPEILDRSERRFFEEFTSKRYKPPDVEGA